MVDVGGCKVVESSIALLGRAESVVVGVEMDEDSKGALAVPRVV